MARPNEAISLTLRSWAGSGDLNSVERGSAYFRQLPVPRLLITLFGQSFDFIDFPY
jgi:hypothetical protein